MKKHIYILITVLLGCSTQTPSNINTDIKNNNINNSTNTNINSNINKQTNKENSKKVSDVFILPDNIQLNLREKSKVIGSVKYEDKTSDNDFNLSVSGESIKIDEQGNITPLTIGKSTITLTSNQDKKKSKSINVNVNPIGKYLLKEDKNISNYLIENNSKDDLILVWSITNNEYSTKIYIQRMDKNYNNTSDIIEINDFKNVDPNSLKVKLNNNGEILLAGIFNKNDLIVFDIDNKNFIKKNNILSKPYNHENYFFDFLDNGYFYVNFRETNEDILYKVYDEKYNIVFSDTKRIPINSYTPSKIKVLDINNKIYIFYSYEVSNSESYVEIRIYNLDGKEEKSKLVQLKSLYNIDILKNKYNILIIGYSPNQYSSRYFLYDFELNEIDFKEFNSLNIQFSESNELEENDIPLRYGKYSYKNKQIEKYNLFYSNKFLIKNTKLLGNYIYVHWIQEIDNLKRIYIQKFDKNFNLL